MTAPVVTDVLVAFDGSEPARAALRRAIAPSRFAVGCAGRLHESDNARPGRRGPHRPARRRRAKGPRGARARDRRPGAGGGRGRGRARAEPRRGRPARNGRRPTWRAILKEARRRDSDLVVCSTRGLGGFGRAVLGSTSSGLVHHADRPVLVLPEGEPPANGPLLIAYDHSEPARGAIRAAARLFPGQEAIVASAWRSSTQGSLTGRTLLAAPDSAIRDIARELDERQEESASAIATEGAALAAGLGLDARAAHAQAAASDWSAIAEEAHRAGASVVVASSRGQGAALGALLGSVSSGLAHNAELPTLIARCEGSGLKGQHDRG